MSLSGVNTPVQSEPGRDGNKGVLCISQSSKITGTPPSDCLVSYPGHSLVESYPSTEMQAVNSASTPRRQGQLKIGFEIALLGIE